MRKAEGDSLIKEVVIARRSLMVSHLFFVDHSFIFMKLSNESREKLKDVLHSYEVNSGQKVNLGKSIISFVPMQQLRLRVLQKVILGIPLVNCHEKYLGLPTMTGRNKKRYFASFKKLKAWNEKNLTKARKEVLLKAVFQSIPAYFMSIFKLPLSLYNE